MIVGAALLQITDPVLMTRMYIVLLAVAGAVASSTVWKRTTGPASPTAPAFFSLMKFGLPSALSTLPQIFSVRLDQLMVAALLPPVSLACMLWPLRGPVAQR